jgi:TetR/AcrR family transcriptional regulator, transcriptional repressor for nem operon
MRNSEVTIYKILRKSATLFNTQGYKATSISDITDATGFTKGAIYRHFKSKDELEKKALYYLSEQMNEKLRTIIKSEPTAGNKMRAILTFFETYATNPPVKGGCPLLNAAVEADDTNPVLRQGALKILNDLKNSILIILEKGIKYGQLKKNIDKNYYATVIVAALEGAIMMSKLRGTNDDLQTVIKHLGSMITEIEV